MDAVIDRFKSRTGLAAPLAAPWTSAPRERFASTTPERLVAGGSRIVLVAPHPDDEVLALGATVAALARRGHEVLIVAVTDGEGSHPASPHWTTDLLRETRPHESRLALERLGLPADMLRLGLPDGGVAAHEKTLAALLPVGSNDTVFVTWRHDGHADHEACARAALAACRTVGARCIEFPVWSLVPTHAAHARLRPHMLERVAVPDDLLIAKRHAIAAFASQLQPDGQTPAVLTDDALNTWQGASEWVLA